jgi:hypothetical protein
VPLAKHNDMVKLFPPERANQPFRMPILPGRAWRNRPITNARGTKPPGENLAIDPVTIPNQVFGRAFPLIGLGELAGHPFCRRMGRHAEP